MAFTRDFDEARPADTDAASLGDDEIRYVRVDVADRLKTLLYGFIAGENTYDSHLKQAVFREQASIDTPAESFGTVACKAVAGKCELHWVDEDAHEKQLTAGGNLKVVHADIPADAVDDTQIQLLNDAYLKAKDAAGTGEVSLIKANASDLPVLPDGAQLATSAAPTADAGIANKKYVDDHSLGASGDVVFNTHVTASDTFEDLDLSAKVGTNIALVLLEVKCAGTHNFAVKPKGFGGAYAYHTNSGGSANGGGAGAASFEPDNYRYFVSFTNAAGLIEIGCSSGSTTLTIKLIGYKKL